MNFSKYIFFIASFVCLLGRISPLEAQDSGKKFRVLAWGSDIGLVYFTQSTLPAESQTSNPSPDPDYKETLLNIPSAYRSGFYPYDPQKPLNFVRHKGGSIVLIETLDLSKGPDLPLLLFLPSKAVDSLNVRVLGDDEKNFPGGSFFCFNFSNVPVTFRLKNKQGMDSQSFLPDQSQLITPTFDSGATSLMLYSGTNHSLDYSSIWLLDKNTRYLIFFVNNKDNPNKVSFERVGDNL